jgi:hypothetical protein
LNPSERASSTAKSASTGQESIGAIASSTLDSANIRQRD